MKGIVTKIGSKIVVSEVYDQGTDVAGLRFYEISDKDPRIESWIGKELHYQLVPIENKTFAEFL